MTIRVAGPDGVVVEFPNGTSPDAIKAAMQKKFGAPAKPAAQRNPDGTYGSPPPGTYYEPATGQMVDPALKPMTRGEAIAAGGSQGAMLGTADEAMGPFAPGGREHVRQRLDMAQEEYPWTYGISEVGGAVAGTLGLGKLAGAGLRALGIAAPSLLSGGGAMATAGRGAGVGAAEGALYGFNSGEGGFANRAQNAAETAVVGAGVGAAAPGAVSAAGGLVRGVADPASGVVDALLNRPSTTRAARTIGRGIQRSGKDADTLARELEQAAAEGQPEFVLADALGHPGQRMLSGVARQPGDYRAQVVDALNQRQAGQGDRLARFTAEALDAPDTAAQRRAAMTGARDQAADVAYDAARGNAAPVDIRDALATIDDRIGGMADSGVAGDGIDAKLRAYRNRLAAPADALEEGVAARELSDFNRVLGVKQDLGDDIGAAVMAGRKNEARELMKLQKALDAALEDASPSYRAANDDFARASREIDAIDTGSAATSGRRRAEDTIDIWNKLTPEQKRAFRAGYADPLLAKIDNSAEGVNKARDLRRPKVRAEMGAMANDPPLLNRRVDREDIMFETRRQATGGSQTADNLADQADVSGPGGHLLRAAGNVANLQFGSALGNIGQAAKPFATGQNEATRAMIAEALMSREPKKALAAAMRQAEKDAATRRVAEALMRQGAIRNY